MRITVIHTTSATIASLGELIRREIPGAELFNILDDSILGDMNEGREIGWVRERWLEYARIAQKNGSQAVLSACSTVGEFAQEADKMLDIPVYRIDEAMALEAVRRGGVVCVFATLASTMEPTVRLIQTLADKRKNKIEIQTVLVQGAYRALMNGDREFHDRAIEQALEKYGTQASTMVLAQASMASAAQTLSEKLQKKVLTSPLLGIRKLRDDLAALEG